MSRQFDYEYHQALDGLTFTREQKSTLAAQAARAAQAAGKAQRRTRRPLGKMAVIAACLTVVLAVGASAAGILPSPAEVFGPLFGGTVAQTEVIDKIGHPIGASDTDNGITITADAIMGDEYNAVIVYTISRNDGERFLPEGRDLPSSQLMIGGFGGSSWARGGSHGSAWFVDDDPDDDRVQYVETVTSDVSLTKGTATAEFWNLCYWDVENQAEAPLYEGKWKFRFEVDYEDCSVHLGGGETISQDDLTFTIDEVTVSPIAVRAAYTADLAVVWDNGENGRQSPEDARQTQRYLESIEILLTKTDGTVIDLSGAGGSINPDYDANLSHCAKGQVLEEIIPLEDMASISVGGVVFPIGQ